MLLVWFAAAVVAVVADYGDDDAVLSLMLLSVFKLSLLTTKLAI